MKIVVDARWDDEAKMWAAAARGDIGLVTEAPTIEALERRIALVVPDLLQDEADGPFEIELIARRSQSIAA
jgi:Domain of unknown function (DUF1902)